MELSPEQKKKLAKAHKVALIVERGNLGVAEHLLELEDELEAKHQEIKDYVSKNIEELRADFPDLDKVLESVKGPKGDTGEVGPEPSDERLKELIIPLIPEPIEGKQGEMGVRGRTGAVGERGPRGHDGKNGQDGKDGANGKDGKDGKDVDEEKIIKYLEKKLPQIDYSRLGAHGIAGRDLFQDIDISASFDGVTKTFNIPAVWRIINVDLSSFPYGGLRKNIDYTWTPTSITFTSTIDASTQLSVGQTCILTVVVG